MEWQKYGTAPELDKLVDSENKYVRKEAAEHGYGLNILINDENIHVRAAVAKQGYGLDILINDKEDFIRDIIAKRGYGLNKLIHDKDSEVKYHACQYLKEHNLTLEEWMIQNPDKVYHYTTSKDLLQRLVGDIKSLYSTVQAEACAGSDSHCYDDTLNNVDKNLAILAKYRDIIDFALDEIEIEDIEDLDL